jgi:hypothetical protein
LRQHRGSNAVAAKDKQDRKRYEAVDHECFDEW